MMIMMIPIVCQIDDTKQSIRVLVTRSHVLSPPIFNNITRIDGNLWFTPPNTVGFYQKYCHFCPTFHDEIDESFLRFFSLTLLLLDSILLVDV